MVIVMHHDIIKELVEWKNVDSIKPIFFQGMKHVGKTFLTKQFGKTYFNRYLYIDCESSSDMLRKTYCNGTIPCQDFLTNLGHIFKQRINTTDLLILDELLHFPEAQGTYILKFIRLHLPQLKVIFKTGHDWTGRYLLGFTYYTPP